MNRIYESVAIGLDLAYVRGVWSCDDRLSVVMGGEVLCIQCGSARQASEECRKIVAALNDYAASVGD